MDTQQYTEKTSASTAKSFDPARLKQEIADWAEGIKEADSDEVRRALLVKKQEAERALHPPRRSPEPAQEAEPRPDRRLRLAAQLRALQGKGTAKGSGSAPSRTRARQESLSHRIVCSRYEHGRYRRQGLHEAGYLMARQGCGYGIGIALADRQAH